MPYKSEKIKLADLQDRRRKLTDEQKEQIKNIYAAGVCGMRPLAKQFGVSRSLIQVIVNPEIAEKKKNHVKEHWKEYQRSGKEWNETMKKYRHHKQELYLNGELKDN